MIYKSPYQAWSSSLTIVLLLVRIKLEHEVLYSIFVLKRYVISGTLIIKQFDYLLYAH